MSLPFSATNRSRICWSLMPDFCMLTILALLVLHTGQPGGITQAIFWLQPQLHFSFDAMRLICGESISVAVWATAAAIMMAIRKLLFHLCMFPRDRYHFRARIYQTALAGDQADDGADQNSPISDPDPAHQREHVGLQHRALAVVGCAAQIQIHILLKAPRNRHVRSRLP